MYAFNYSRAETLSDVATLPDDALFLAGGQGLLPELKVRARKTATLLDIKTILPTDIRIDGKHVSIGAGTTHADLAADPSLHDAAPVLSALAANIGDPSSPKRIRQIAPWRRRACSICTGFCGKIIRLSQARDAA